MNTRPGQLVLFGGEPAFTDTLHVAQVNLPGWEKLENTFSGIFKRQYYSNNGPLVQQLDSEFADLAGTKHAISVTNGTLAIMILVRALEITGEIIIPAYTFPATVQAVIWAGLKPVLCDVDPVTHMLTPETVAPRITSRTRAILGVHLWGRVCNTTGLGRLAMDHGLKLVFDACHAAGCEINGRRIGTFGEGAAFSFHATKIINGAEGGCITTDDDGLADRSRTIRNFHPSETYAEVNLRLNAKMSEAQAAMALLSLEQFSVNQMANRCRYETYGHGLESVPGAELVDLDLVGGMSNYQYIVLDIDEKIFGLSRDMLINVLNAENVICRRHFWPGLHRAYPNLVEQVDSNAFRNTDWIAGRLIQLPNSQSMSQSDVAKICELLRTIQLAAHEIRKIAN